MQNMFEPLLWYNGSSSSEIIPWLAANYTVSPDLTTYSFTLRNGITFQDGEPLNSSAVYFSFNRLLIFDGSTPSTHGTQAAWILQQLLNASLSSSLCGCSQIYNQQWANEVLAQNFVQITGTMTFQIHVMHPTNAVPYLLSNVWAFILAPEYTMQHDVALWNQSSSGYTLPYRTLTGNMSHQIYEYYVDEISTCNAGVTPNGCGTTYLDGSAQGSLGGTGPYILTSINSGDLTLKSNPNYWGGPYQLMGGQKIIPQIQTVYVKTVPSTATRESDLENAADSEQAMYVDIPPANLYDVANRNQWLVNRSIASVIPGVSLYGPYPVYAVDFDQFGVNVTDPTTGRFYTFQPFADIRFRLAFSDAVNMSAENEYANDNLGSVATQLIPPGLPPEGSYNASMRPAYSYDPDESAQLLLSAMENPITRFTFVNGTVAPRGIFNNTFGCSTLPNSGQCATPVKQTIQLTYYTGDSFDEAVDSEIASVVNNISSTYNMGLFVQLFPISTASYTAVQFKDELYFPSGQGWIADYPWSIDFLGPMLAPGQYYTMAVGWNLSAMQNLWNQSSLASATGNISGLVAATDQMDEIANRQVMYLWTIYPEYAWPSSVIGAFTSNIRGYYNNPELSGPYWALMYIQ